MLIRNETEKDAQAVWHVNRKAFEREEEADLVRALNDEGVSRVSLVAEEDGTVVGHVLFTELDIETAEGRLPGLALAPLAVVPERQREGIGSTLVRAGLDACREAGYRFVIVLGHPEYYPRFGFSAALAEPLDAPFSGPAFMALELVPGALDGVRGKVVYAAAFGLGVEG